MTRVVLKDAKTPLGQSLVDDVNDAIRVNMVAGSVSLTGADGAIQDGVDPLIRATVKDYVNSNPIAVVTVDTNGDYVSGSGGGLTDVQLRASAVPVSIAAAVPVTDNGGSLTVDGTFWQAAQPVTDNAGSLTVDNPILSVVGGGVEATAQRVTIASDSTGVLSVDDNGGSLTVDGSVAITNASINVTDNAASLTVDAPVGTPVFVRLSDGVAAITALPVTDNAGSLTVDGTFWQAAQPVTDNAASLTVDAPVATPVFVRLSDGAAAITALPVTDNAGSLTVDGTVTVTPPTLTKGTQGATGFSTQDLKDAGRNQTHYFMAAGVAGTNAEVMQSLTGYKGGVAVGATVTPAVVTSGKTYRVQSISASYQSLATAGAVAIRLRANLSGTGVVTSPLVCTWTIGSAAAVAGITTTEVLPIPDGLEFAAGTGIAIGVLGLSTVGAALAAGFVTVQINGYEY